MYLRSTIHSSLCSMRIMVPMRKADSRDGKIPIERVRRRVSLIEMLDRIRRCNLAVTAESIDEIPWASDRGATVNRRYFSTRARGPSKTARTFSASTISCGRARFLS